MLNELNLAYKEVELNSNIGKTKFMRNPIVSENLTVDNLNIKQVYYYNSGGTIKCVK